MQDSLLAELGTHERKVANGNRGGPEPQTHHLRTTPVHRGQQLVLLLATECILKDNARLCFFELNQLTGSA